MGEMLEGRATASSYPRSYPVLLYDDPDCCERHLFKLVFKEVDSSIQILLLRQLLEELRRAASDDVVISRVGIIVVIEYVGRAG